MKDHVVICGLGQIGFRCVELLHRSGRQVVVVTDKAPDEWRHSVEASGGVVLLGDARSEALLTEAGIQAASAVLAVTDQDLVNISVVMDARRLNPRIRTVCRLFDTNLAPHISNVLGVNQVLSASDIAAPVFISAVVHHAAIARFTYQGQSLSIEEAAPGRVPDGATVLASVVPGERLLGGADSPSSVTATLCLTEAPRAAESSAAPAMFSSALAWLVLPSLMKFRRAVLFMLSVILVAAVVIRLRMHLSWIDAFYFVTTTVTTVGYGDFSFAAAGPGLKLFGIALMLLGAASLTLLFSTLADAFLSERFSSLFGGRNIPRRDHVIVTGAGHIGIRIVEHLTLLRIPVVVIENNRVGRFAADLKRKVAVIEGDARNLETLHRARAGTARAILAVSDEDVENLSMGLTAQTLNPGMAAVVRIFDADFGAKLQSHVASRILSVSAIAAPYFVAATLVDGVAAAVRWRDHLVLLSKATGAGVPLGTVLVRGTRTVLHVTAVPLR